MSSRSFLLLARAALGLVLAGAAACASDPTSVSAPIRYIPAIPSTILANSGQPITNELTESAGNPAPSTNKNGTFTGTLTVHGVTCSTVLLATDGTNTATIPDGNLIRIQITAVSAAAVRI